MPIGITHCYLTPEGEFRHGHTNGASEKEQWHSADTFHRADPDAHERDNSWEPIWSDKNWDVRADKRDQLTREAHYQHDRRRYQVLSWNPRYKRPNRDDYFLTASEVPSTPPAESATTFDEHLEDNEPIIVDEADAEPAENMLAHADAPVIEAATLDGTVDEQLAQLNERVGNIEELAITMAGPFDQRIRQLEDKGSANAHLINDLSETIYSVKRQLGDVDVSKQLNTRLAPLEQELATLKEAAARRVIFEVKDRAGDTHLIEDTQHEAFERLLRLATSLSGERRNIWLQGPAGAGKTTAARKLAEALGLAFEFMPAVSSPYELSGYRSATGTYLDTAFRRVYENGGVILLDEVDGSSPQALLYINAALANGSAAFPDGMVKRHPTTIVLCAANTWGLGGDSNYVGRVKLDAAFLDRFVKLSWNYDEHLERLAAGAPDDWVDVVQEVRAACFSAGAEGMVISPRASITGCELLRAGCDHELVVESIFSMYRKHSMWPRVGEAAERFAQTVKLPAPNQNGAVHASGLRAVNFSGVR